MIADDGPSAGSATMSLASKRSEGHSTRHACKLSQGYGGCNPDAPGSDVTSETLASDCSPSANSFGTASHFSPPLDGGAGGVNRPLRPLSAVSLYLERACPH
eukprot:7205652-Pyramimonas_sp.AAC.1